MLSQQLKIYLKVAEAGSLSKAAEQLYVTPASIMRQMNILENRLEVKLLIRTNHGIRLTPAGQQIYETAKRLEAEAATALTEAKAIEQNETKTIHSNRFFFPASWTRFDRSLEPTLSFPWHLPFQTHSF